MKKLFFTAVLLLFGINVANADVAANQELYAASNVISSFAHDNNFSIPADKVLNAKAVAILTDVKRSAAVVSTQYGDGVFSVKDENGNWSAPIFIKYRGFGVGVQAGYETSDIVMLFQTTKSYQDIFNGTDTLELNVAGSVVEGKRGGAATDLPDISAWIVSPGEVTGVYLGVSLDIGRITIDDQLTNDFYDRIYDYEDILNDSPRDNKYSKIFKSTLKKYLNDNRYYGKIQNKPAGWPKTVRVVNK